MTVPIMSSLQFCCICMNKSDLKHLFDVDNDGVSYYNKLTSSIAEMNFKEMNDQRLICGECCVTLNTVYTFRQTCLRSKTNLIKYLSQLQKPSHISHQISDPIKDVTSELIVVKKERESDNADGNYFEESNQSKFQTDSFEESIHFPASVKEECEDIPSFSFVNTGNVDENASSDVKVEDVGYRVKMEDEHYTENPEIDIEERSLAVVKEESTSDSETPQDGSTSEANSDLEWKKITQCAEDPLAIVKVESDSETPDVTRLHTDERPYKCEICNESFNRNSCLTRHRIIHTDIRPFTCDICNQSFNKNCNLSRHKLIHSDKRPYSCRICNKSFNLEAGLNEHKRIHSGEKRYKCELCNASFNKNCNLTRHKLIHTDAKPYKCNICEQSFNNISNLTRHKLIHSDLKPFKCDICDLSFNKNCSLTSHKLIHSNKRAYVCEICNQSFKKNFNLTRHKLIHTVKKKYKCEDSAEKTFREMSKLEKSLLTKLHQNHEIIIEGFQN